MQHLQNNLAELTAQIESRKLNFISNSNVNPKLSHDTLPSGSLDCTVCIHETKQMTGAVHAETPRTSRRDSPRSRRVVSQHAAPTDGQNVVMYSDEFGSVERSQRLVEQSLRTSELRAQESRLERSQRLHEQHIRTSELRERESSVERSQRLAEQSLRTSELRAQESRLERSQRLHEQHIRTSELRERVSSVCSDLRA
ncbi:hypothetical protein EVAR_7581_1 [Eumeta japonica]|uniref:Uncharacterized protein n=1 Tax=Eumeta variegata TaxID=151549 RepID=A0A4C2A867_EUMVA|nr:hypothetical protein EVAR_7581_1 [Eumeta japonica]